MLFKNLTYTPVQTVTLPTVFRKLNTNKKKSLPEPCCDDCQNNQCSNLLRENLEEVRTYTLLNAEGQECLTDIEKDYTLISIETQFYNFRKGIDKIGIINSPKDLENIISILDEMEIIGERPLAHWKPTK